MQRVVVHRSVRCAQPEGARVSDRYPHVFTPIQIGPVEVKNRIYIPPHGLTQLVTGGPYGSMVPTDDYAYYLAERAAGGVGLVMHPMTTNPRIRNSSPLYEESIPHFRAVADIVHRNGAKLMAQIHMREGAVAWEPLGGLMPLVAPSDGQHFSLTCTTRPMPVEEIHAWMGATGRCARNVAEAGYDGIELHVSHGMLMEMFLSPYFNKRTDEYGGSLDGRLRALIEALRAVHANISDEMAVGIRLNCDEMLPGGLTQDDARDVLTRLIELDLLHFADLDIAVEPQQGPLMSAPQFMPPLHIIGFTTSVAAAARDKIVRMGVGGRVSNLAQVEEIIARGDLDMVGAVRAHIAASLTSSRTRSKDARIATGRASRATSASAVASWARWVGVASSTRRPAGKSAGARAATYRWRGRRKSSSWAPVRRAWKPVERRLDSATTW